MNISQLMKRHHIERIVYRQPTEELPFASFHAWPEDGLHDVNLVGRGPTVEAAIHDCVARKQKDAA